MLSLCWARSISASASSQISVVTSHCRVVHQRVSTDVMATPIFGRSVWPTRGRIGTGATVCESDDSAPQHWGGRARPHVAAAAVRPGRDERSWKSFLVQEDPRPARDRLLDHLGELHQQPGQRHLEPDLLVADLNTAHGGLTQRAHAKVEAVLRPGLFLHLEHGKILRRRAKRRLDPAQGLLFTQAMRDDEDKWFHVSLSKSLQPPVNAASPPRVPVPRLSLQRLLPPPTTLATSYPSPPGYRAPARGFPPAGRRSRRHDRHCAKRSRIRLLLTGPPEPSQP